MWLAAQVDNQSIIKFNQRQHSLRIFTLTRAASLLKWRRQPINWILSAPAQRKKVVAIENKEIATAQ